MKGMFCKCGALKELTDKKKLACRKCKPELFPKQNKTRSKNREKSAITQQQEKQLREDYEAGLSIRKSAKQRNMSTSTVQRYWSSQGFESKNKTSISKTQHEKIVEAVDEEMTTTAGCKYAGVSRTTFKKHKERIIKNRTYKNNSRLVEIVEQISDGIVFAERGELESLLELASDNKIKGMLTECISDIKGGVYIRFSCTTENKEIKKHCYIYGDLEDIDYTMDFALNDVPCDDKNICGEAKLQNNGIKKCKFNASYRQIQKAKRLLKSMS